MIAQAGSNSGRRENSAQLSPKLSDNDEKLDERLRGKKIVRCARACNDENDQREQGKEKKKKSGTHGQKALIHPPEFRQCDVRQCDTTEGK